MKATTLSFLLIFISCINSQEPSKNLLLNPSDWQVSNYGSGGSIKFSNSSLNIEMGDPIQGVNWVGSSLPKNNYSLTFEAMRTQGNDFFVGLTFPIKEQFCSLIISGWGGTVSGLSSINGLDASENESTCDLVINNNQWYKIELKVQDKVIKVFFDEKEIINILTHEKVFSIRPEVEPSKPLGLASFYTSAQYRNFFLKKLN
jgi:hypothetical protein